MSHGDRGFRPASSMESSTGPGGIDLGRERGSSWAAEEETQGLVLAEVLHAVDSISSHTALASLLPHWRGQQRAPAWIPLGLLSL